MTLGDQTLRGRDRFAMVCTVAGAKTQTAAAAVASSLLEPSPSGRGTASKAQTLGNIIVSIVGTGVLGLPFAFCVAGWFAGFLGVSIAGLATYYCMLLIVECKDKWRFGLRERRKKEERAKL